MFLCSLITVHSSWPLSLREGGGHFQEMYLNQISRPRIRLLLSGSERDLNVQFQPTPPPTATLPGYAKSITCDVPTKRWIAIDARSGVEAPFPFVSPKLSKPFFHLPQFSSRNVPYFNSLKERKRNKIACKTIAANCLYISAHSKLWNAAPTELCYGHMVVKEGGRRK